MPSVGDSRREEHTVPSLTVPRQRPGSRKPEHSPAERLIFNVIHTQSRSQQRQTQGKLGPAFWGLTRPNNTLCPSASSRQSTKCFLLQIQRALHQQSEHRVNILCPLRGCIPRTARCCAGWRGGRRGCSLPTPFRHEMKLSHPQRQV